MNNVQLIGRLTRDPETKTGSITITNFTIAIDRPKKQDGTQETDFPRIVCFGKTAELAERYLRKGARVGISGKIQTGSYVNQSGDKVYTTDVVANSLDIIDWPERTEQAVPAQRTTPESDPFEGEFNPYF